MKKPDPLPSSVLTNTVAFLAFSADFVSWQFIYANLSNNPVEDIKYKITKTINIAANLRYFLFN